MIKNKQGSLSILMLCLMLIGMIIPSMSQVPADLMENCKQWKITYPTGIEEKKMCDEANNEFFYVNEDGDAIVFYAPIRSDNGTTPNSDNIRSELRERTSDGTADIYWTTEGTHVLYVKQAITHLPIKKSELVASQIHGNKEAGIDDSMVLRLNDSHLLLSFNGGKLRSNVTIKTNYILGTVHEVIFKVVDGKHYCYYSEDGNLLNAYKSDNASPYLIKADGNDYVMDLNYGESYFKVGNYTQSNPTDEGENTDDPNNYGEVLVYNFYVEHNEAEVTGVLLSPKAVNLSVNSTYQFSESISPSNATNKNVTYSSSNPSIAKISSTGLVTGVSTGKATITVTTHDGDYSDTSVVTVVENSVGSNLALNKSITGTGTHDGDNKVSNLVDGIAGTRWSVSGYPQTATIDLGEEYVVGRTEVICYTDRAYKYTISISNAENGTYTEIVDRSENEVSGTESNPIVDVFSGVNGRFVKITVTGAKNYTGTWVSLSEVKIYEDSFLSIDRELTIVDDIFLWPNPANDSINIGEAKDFNMLLIYDEIGKLVVSQDIKESFIDISELTSGMYIFKFSSNSKTMNKRVIKR